MNNISTKRGLFNGPATTSSHGGISAGLLRNVALTVRQSRYIQLLIALLAVQLLMSIVLGVRSSQQTSFATGEALLIADVAAVNKIEIQGATDSVTLLKTSDEWQINGEFKLPVQANKVENVLETITTLKIGLPVASSEIAREQLKVAEDSFLRRVTISGDGIESTTLLLGSSPGLRKSHIRREGGNDIYSASLPVSDLPDGVDEWLDKSLLSFKDITSVEANDIRFSLSDESDEKVWSISKPDDFNRKIDSSRFEAAVNVLQTLRVSGVADAQLESDEDESTEVFEIRVASDKPETTLTIMKKGDVVTANRGDVSGTYTLAVAQYDQLSTLAALDSFSIDSDDGESMEGDAESEEIAAEN